ncbi:MAG: hypothetical protein JNM09_16160 [Blastocatellia bacterium]|nr:hypothetical protein [Blastocatellia bacterium]
MKIRWQRTLGVLAGLALLLVGAAVEPQHATAQKKPQTHQIKVNADGSFTPSVLRIRDGDTVEWQLNGRTNAIIPAVAEPTAGDCPSPRSFAPNDPNNFTGPMPFALSGVFTISPLERGYRVERWRCSFGRPLASAGNQVLCATGTPYGTMDSTWRDPNLTGVFIRLLWNDVHKAPGQFDFTLLDREIEKAVRNGKVYLLGFKAGSTGTPDWIFSTDANGRPRPNNGGGVTRLKLQDLGDDPTGRGGCGVPMDLGTPTDAMYQKHYFALLTKVAEHIRARSDWYRALAYLKPGGANLFTHENRLPKHCAPGCVCNPQVFAQNGYTPSGLLNFYQQQFALLVKQFPGKPMSYALIQDGFPLVNDSGGWETAKGNSSNGKQLPRGVAQTEAILELGQREHGNLFVVQHNGLMRQPPRGTCPNENEHPAKPPYARAGTGCPNRWVLEAGADGQTVTGFQDVNAQKVSNPADVASSLQNMLVNSDGVFLEIYEERFWEIQNTNGGVLPDGKTLGQWAELLHKRRQAFFPKLNDPFPKIHRHTLRRTNRSGAQTFYYYDPTSCGNGKPTFGTIIVEP